MLIRVRSNAGVWRVDDLNEHTSTVDDILRGIASTRPNVVYEKPLSRDPGCNDPLPTTGTLSSIGLAHGSMVHCRVDASTCAEAAVGGSTNLKRVIENGKIKVVQTDGAEDGRGFRKGQMPLRDMKMQWTLNDFIALDSQYEFKIKRQEQAVCTGTSLDTPSVNDFQNYLRRFNFSRQRCGFLFGKFTDDNRAVVEAIYEPPQEADPDSPEGFVLLEDEQEETVEKLAEMLGLKKVGWIIGHPPREKGFVMSAAEVIMAAELQLEAAGSVDESTPFVTVKVTVGDDGNVSVEAFQMSKQCMAMVAEEALEIGPNPGFCVVNDTFTAIQEGKPSKTIENNFFLTVVPIVQHTSDMFVSQFPKANRDIDERNPSNHELKQQLSKSGTAGWTFVDLLADFNLLVFLCKTLDVDSDIAQICKSIVDRNVPLNDGFKLIIASMAGLDSSY